MLSADNIANMREQGIVLFGEPPTKVLPRVSVEDVRAAVREMLADQDASATERQAADEIVSLLRSMRALETGGPTTKSDGIRWGRWFSERSESLREPLSKSERLSVEENVQSERARWLR